MNRDTGTTMKPIRWLVPLDTRFWQHNAMREFLAILCCTNNIFSIRTCVDVYGLLCTAKGVSSCEAARGHATPG